jgi:hypothetical protein
MLTASCHCGGVRIEVPRKPPRLTDCNCSICRRYGALWAYYRADTVRVHVADRVKLRGYAWGDKALNFVRCGRCGCVTHWERVEPFPGCRMGVNARNFEPGIVGGVRVRRLDGAKTWKYLD